MTKTPGKALTSSKKKQSDSSANPANVTLGLAINMAWQLVIVVLVPILAGHALDSRSGTGTTWTLIGVVIAMLGMIAVVWQTVKQLNKYMQDSQKDSDD